MHALALTLFVLAIVPTIFIFGPVIEDRVYPVLSIKTADVSIDKVGGGQAVCFRLSVDKQRPCRLDILSFRWHLDHSAEAAAVYHRRTGQPFQPQLIQTGRFTTPQLCTKIPDAVYNHKMVNLRGTLFYDCHALWPLSAEFKINLEVPQASLPGNYQATTFGDRERFRFRYVD